MLWFYKLILILQVLRGISRIVTTICIPTTCTYMILPEEKLVSTKRSLMANESKAFQANDPQDMITAGPDV